MRVKWSDFKEMVKDHTPVDADRENIAIRTDGRPAYYDLLVRAAFADMQTYIEYYRFEHENLFKVGNITQDGMASKFTIPGDGNAKVTQVKQIYRGPKNTCDCPVASGSSGEVEIVSRLATAIWYDWKNRDDMICGKCDIMKPLVALQPGMEVGYIFPQLMSTSPDNDTAIEMVVIWDGVKRDFKDDDEIRAGIEEAETVSYYVLSKLDRQIREVGIADRHWDNYLLKRRTLYVDRRDQAENIRG